MNHEEAIARRSVLVSTVDRLQDALSLMDKEAGGRREVLRQLRSAQEELRSLKDWLRVHDPVKESEWRLLGRAYCLLERLHEGEEIPDEEIDAVLDAIEAAVPKKHLETT